MDRPYYNTHAAAPQLFAKSEVPAFPPCVLRSADLYLTEGLQAKMEGSAGGVMMCRCAELGEYVETYRDDAPSFDAGFVTVSIRCDIELRRCQDCGSFWQVDTDGRRNLAIRIHDPGNWNHFDDRSIRLQWLIDHHGGLGSGKCTWAGCGRVVLNGMRLCPHHVYPELSDELNR